MRRLIAGLASILAVLVLAVAAAPFVLPADWIRDRVVAAVETASGLRLSLNGPVSLSVLPVLALDAREVAIARPDAPTLAEIGRVRFALALGPLIDGRVEVTGLTLDRPSVTLAVDAAGVPNWTGAAAPETPARTGAGAGPGFAISVSDIEITEGTLAYSDAVSGRTETITGLSLDTALTDLAAPLSAEGSFTARGVTAAFTAAFETPARFLAERRGDMALTLTVGDASLTARGAIDLAAPAPFAGILSLAVPDTRATAAALGVAPPPAATLKADGRVTLSPTRVEATDLVLVADATTVSGAVGVDLTGTRPRVDAHLAVDAIDLDRLSAGGRGGGRGDGGEIDPALLSIVDGGVDLKVGRVTGAAFGPLGAVEGLHIVAVAEAGAVSTVIDGVRLAGGTLGVRAKARPDKNRLRVDGTVTADGFDVGALAALGGAAAPLGGKLGADVTFAAAGRSVAALAETLDMAGRVSLSGGTLTGLGLADAFGDPAADRLEAIRTEASFGSLADPLRLEGTARFRKRPVAFTATVDPRRILDGQTFPLLVDVASGGVRAAFDGDVLPSQGTVTGRASLDADGLASLAGLAGRPAEGLPAGALRVSADIETALRAITVDNLRVKLGDGGFSGSLSLDLRERPRLKARFDGPVIDLGGLLAGAAGAAGPSGETAAPGGWSDAPLDLSGLGAFDADVGIAAGSLRYGDLATGRAAATLAVAGGRLTVDLTEAALFGGQATGTVTVDAAGGVPAVAARFSLDGSDIGPVLAATVGTDRIVGRASANLDLASTGRSMRALVSGLSGEVSADIRDGALRGVDLPALLRSVATAITTGFGANAKAATPFTRLSARFKVEQGVATTTDLTLASPVVTAAGAGRIDLSARSLALRVEPSLRVPDSSDGLSFEVPVIVEGPWSAPRIYPDVQGILQDPAAAYEKLRSLGGLFGQFAAAPRKQSMGAVLDGIVPGLGAVAAGKGGTLPNAEGLADDLIGAATGGALVGADGNGPSSLGGDALDVLIGSIGPDETPADAGDPAADGAAGQPDPAAPGGEAGAVPLPRPRPGGPAGDVAAGEAPDAGPPDGESAPDGEAAVPAADPAPSEEPAPAVKPERPAKPKRDRNADADAGPGADAGGEPAPRPKKEKRRGEDAPAPGPDAPPADAPPPAPVEDAPQPLPEAPAEAAPPEPAPPEAAPQEEAAPADTPAAPAESPPAENPAAEPSAAPAAACADGAAPPCAAGDDPLGALIGGDAPPQD